MIKLLKIHKQISILELILKDQETLTTLYFWSNKCSQH